MAGPDLHPLVDQRLQSVAGRLDDRGHGVEQTEAWAKGLVANLARPPQGGDTDQIKAVAAGECDVAVVNHYYFVRLLKRDSADERAIADRSGSCSPIRTGAARTPTSAAPGRGRDRAEQGQRDQVPRVPDDARGPGLLRPGQLRVPGGRGVKLDPVLEQWGEIKTDAVNAAKLGENNPEAVKLMDRVGWK